MYRGKLIYGANFVTPIVRPMLNCWPLKRTGNLFTSAMVAQVAELYFQLRGLDERLVITQRTNETRKEYLRIITLRFERGEVSELDKLQAENIAASSEAQLYSS